MPRRACKLRYSLSVSIPRLLAFAACTLMATRLFAQAQAEPPGLEAIPRSEDYILRSWIAHDGLPDVEIQDITQTRNGYLWIATLRNGMARFDGVRFTDISDSAGLQSASTTAVLTSRDGTLWAATDLGSLVRLRGGRFQIEIPAPSGMGRAITSLAEDAEGVIWAGLQSSGCVLSWKDGKNQSFSLGDGGDPISLCTATNGTVWFTSYRHYGFFDGREFHSLPLPDNACGQLAAARAGGMWTIAGQKLLHLQENGKSEIVADVPHQRGAQIYAPGAAVGLTIDPRQVAALKADVSGQ